MSMEKRWEPSPLEKIGSYILKQKSRFFGPDEKKLQAAESFRKHLAIKEEVGEAQSTVINKFKEYEEAFKAQKLAEIEAEKPNASFDIKRKAAEAKGKCSALRKEVEKTENSFNNGVKLMKKSQGSMNPYATELTTGELGKLVQKCDSDLFKTLQNPQNKQDSVHNIATQLNAATPKVPIPTAPSRESPIQSRAQASEIDATTVLIALRGYTLQLNNDFINTRRGEKTAAVEAFRNFVNAPEEEKRPDLLNKHAAALTDGRLGDIVKTAFPELFGGLKNAIEQKGPVKLEQNKIKSEADIAPKPDNEPRAYAPHTKF